MPNYSSRYGNAFSGLVSGVGTGAPLGLPGMIAGGIVGLGSGLFSKSDEEIMQERYEAYKRSVLEQKAKAITEGTQKIGKLTSGLSARFRSGAGRRAAAMGRTNEVESFELPVVSQVASEGNKALGNFITDTNQLYDNALLDAERDFQFNRPVQPGIVDYLAEAAPAAIGLMQNQQYLDIIGNGGQAPPTGVVDDEAIANFMQPSDIPTLKQVNPGLYPARKRSGSGYGYPDFGRLGKLFNQYNP